MEIDQIYGGRHREHKTRKHGIMKDRYFAIYHQIADEKTGRKKRKEEAVGWASRGRNIQKAAGLLGDLKKKTTFRVKVRRCLPKCAI